MQQMPLFSRTFDFLTWLMPITGNFPRSQRFVLTKRLLDAALDFQEMIIQAQNRRGRERLFRLDRADEGLDRIRIYMRLAFRWGWLKQGQYLHAAQMVEEMGRLLGGWKKTVIG